jgi:hypothetical protein
MIHKTRILPRQLLLLVWAILGLTIWLPAPLVIAYPPTTLACDSLQATPIGDKNSFVLSATSSASNNTAVTGYDFNFGDYQSYSFDFTNSMTDRQQASVTHTYATAGTYTAHAQVRGRSNNKAVTATSSGCRTTIAIQPSAVTTLPNTGAGDAVSLFFIVSGLGTALHVIWLRQRRIHLYKTSK